MIKVWTDNNPTKITLPTPSDFGWQYSDIDKDSGRNDYGLMERNRIGSKHKITLSWNADKDSQANNEMMAILMGLPPFFYCEFPCADGTIKQMECYRGDIKANMYRYDPNTNTIWKDRSVNFIQR